MKLKKNESMLRKVLFMGFAILSLGLYAQEKIVTGTVTDMDGIPVAGANVIVKGTQSGAAADFDGNYSISVSEGQTLVFSSLGFKPKEQLIGAANRYDVRLETDSALLDEVVVVGYGTTTKSDVTGAIVGV